LACKSLICVLALAAPLCGQELQVSSLVLSRGRSGSVSIKLLSPPGKAPAALQWDLVFPVGQVNIEDTAWSVGGAASAAAKQLTCVRQLRKQPETYLYKCILAGGRQTIGNGDVAVVKIDIPEGAPTGLAVLRLENVMGASSAATRLDIKPAQSTITIRASEPPRK